MPIIPLRHASVKLKHGEGGVVCQAGAAQHCYAHGLSVGGVGTSLPAICTGLFSSVPGMKTGPSTTSAQGSAAASGATSPPEVVQPHLDASEVADESTAASEATSNDVSDAASVPAAGPSIQSASGWTAAIAGLGWSLWPSKNAPKGVEAPPAAGPLEPERSTVAVCDLPISCSASQQLTPRRSSSGGQS